ncbi:MAG: hydrogenase maturation protease [Actinomycetota bacterium]|nr:hydrogenase maturation protease [Actinomycetota bacterium]
MTSRVLIGGVGYRWFGDGSFGLVVSDALALLEWPAGVDVEDLGYGALHVALHLAEVDPPYERVILIGVTERGREPGRLYRFPCERTEPDNEEIQARMYEAGAGVIDLDHLVVIGRHFDALPDDVIAIELEPHPGTVGDGLTPDVQALVPQVVDLVRQEVSAAMGAPPASVRR